MTAPAVTTPTNPMAMMLFPNLVANKARLSSLGNSLSSEERANLESITGINGSAPENSPIDNLGRMEQLLARNPNGIQNMESFLQSTPPQLRAQILKQAAQTKDFSVIDRIAQGNMPNQTYLTATQPAESSTQSAPPVQTAAATTQQQPSTEPQQTTPGNTQPTSAADAGTQSQPPQASAPQAQGSDMLQQLMASNPQMASIMDRMSSIMQGIMSNLLTGLLGFVAKIFGGMDGSGGSLFTASNNQGSNNLGNALAIGGADQNLAVSRQVGDDAPQNTTVGALQQTPTPVQAPQIPAPDYRLSANEPEFTPGMS